MQPTYAHIEMLILTHASDDRAPQMPLLGFVTGVTLAVVLWTVIAGLMWALLV